MSKFFKKTGASDLRTALELYKGMSNQYVETDVEIDPKVELPAVYRYFASGTVPRPTCEGPAVMFNQVKGYPGCRIVVGVLGSRKRVSRLFGVSASEVGFMLNEAIQNPIDPIKLPVGSNPPCQEVVHYATDEDFDIRKILPMTQATAQDAGPCITMGIARATDPETGTSDVTIHRIFSIGRKDELSFSIYKNAGRHIGNMFDKAEAANVPLPITISIGVDPAISIGTCLTPPATPEGMDELGVAGGIRGEGVELAPCLTIPEYSIARAEYVIEGELLPNKRVSEDIQTNGGKAMPEFPGYLGNNANHEANVLRIKAVTHRRDPIFQTCIGPSEEHVSMEGIPAEACMLNLLQKSLPGFVKNVYAHPAGGGKLMAVLQVKKRWAEDDGLARQAALVAFSAFTDIKHIFLVDDDVDLFDSSDVLWALTTRFQGDLDTVYIPRIRCHTCDPSSAVEYNSHSYHHGMSCKMIFDCTVPYEQRSRFQRAPFEKIDPRRFFPGKDLFPMFEDIDSND